MDDHITQELVSSVRTMTDSVNTMGIQLVRMETEHKNVAGSVDKLTDKVDGVKTAVTELQGKSKSLGSDVKRIEKSFRFKVDDLKTRELPMIAKTEISGEIDAHEDRFMHKQKGAISSTPIRPIDPQPIDNLGIKVPRWLLVILIAVGVTLASGLAFLAKNGL